MKKFTSGRVLMFCAFAVFMASCATTPKTSSSQNQNDDDISISEGVSTTEAKVRREPKPISVQNTSNQLEKSFKEKLDELEIKVTASPKTTVVEKSFNSPFTVQVKDASGAVSDFELTVQWPVGRANGTITYSTTQVKTDAEGFASFNPAAPKFAVKDFVSIYPTPVSSSPAIVQAAYERAVTIPFAAKSKYLGYPGGVLFTYDFNESGKPTTNNFTLLQTLRNYGINVGNSPVSDTSYCDKPVSALYKATYDITGPAYNFMVSGTFKYAEPSVETEDGVKVTLTADITCVDMKNGNVLYKTVFSETTTDKTKWNAEQKCRKLLAEKAADAIIYGM